MARLLAPESAALGAVAREVGIGVSILERWRSDALAQPAREQVWTAAARFDAVLMAVAMDEAGKSAGCRAHGMYAQQRAAWQQSAPQALAAPGEARASPLQTQQARRRIKELERALLRKGRALVETAAQLLAVANEPRFADVPPALAGHQARVLPPRVSDDNAYAESPSPSI